MENPSDYITFNSITNNNVLGDERNFVRISEVGAHSIFSDSIKVEAGKEYEIYIAFHNNAKSSLNKSGVGIAKDVVISSNFPGVINKNEGGYVEAVITCPYANPTQIWDSALMTTDSDEDLIIRYISDSAKIYNSGKVKGSVLSEEIFKKGVFIGINKLDGIIPGCAEYSGHILFRLRAEKKSNM